MTPATDRTPGWAANPAHFQPATSSTTVWPSIIMFMYGAGWSIAFDLGVRIYAAEVISLLGLVILPWRSLFGKYKALRMILVGYGLWITAIAIADIVNGTGIFAVARNMSTPILGGASVVFVVAMLSRQPSAIVAFLVGTIIFKGILGDASYGDTFSDVTVEWATIQADTNIFKVRVDPVLTPALILFSCLLARSSLYWAAGLLGLSAVAYFALDSRSSALVLLLTSSLLLALRSGYRPKLSHMLITALITLPLLYAAYIAYVDYTLTYNPAGHNGKQLAILDNPYNPFALLVTARSEWLIWPIAFGEKPFFGWGSWALDPNGRFEALRLYLLRQDNTSSALELGYIPVHSVVGAALVWSGLLGLAAIAYLLKTILSLVLSLHTVNRTLLPAAAFFSFMVLFHFFFSPPQHVRISFPIALGLLIVATAHAARFAPKRTYRQTLTAMTKAAR